MKEKIIKEIIVKYVKVYISTYLKPFNFLKKNKKCVSLYFLKLAYNGTGLGEVK